MDERKLDRIEHMDERKLDRIEHMNERKLTHLTKSKIDDNNRANLNHVNESWCTWMKLGHFTIKDLDEFHDKDENDKLD
jgi:hypothetical protein